MAVYFLPKSRTKAFLARTDLPADVMIIDVSAKGPDGWNVLAPTYDHGDIPVPGMTGVNGRSVEAIWEALKKFTFEPEDLTLLAAEKPKKRKETDASGPLLGHMFGPAVLREPIEARRRIWIPAYTWMARRAPAAREKFEELVALADKHTLHIHCGGESGHWQDPKPYAHSALLVDLIKDARRAAAARQQEAVVAAIAP